MLVINIKVDGRFWDDLKLKLIESLFFFGNIKNYSNKLDCV